MYLLLIIKCIINYLYYTNRYLIFDIIKKQFTKFR